MLEDLLVGLIVFAVLVVIAVLGVAVDVALRVLRDRVGRWVG